MIPTNLNEAFDALDTYVIENLMPPPHYKYRLNALMSQKLLSWDIENKGEIPVLQIHFPNANVTAEQKELGYVKLSQTHLQLTFDSSKVSKFLKL